jgi:hypothetical protein
VDDPKRIKSINNYISKRLELLKKREQIKKQIDELYKEMKLIDKVLPKNRFNPCPMCDHISDTKELLTDHLYKYHAY